jgi:hypothetical protein
VSSAQAAAIQWVVMLCSATHGELGVESLRGALPPSLCAEVRGCSSISSHSRGAFAAARFASVCMFAWSPDSAISSAARRACLWVLKQPDAVMRIRAPF